MVARPQGSSGPALGRPGLHCYAVSWTFSVCTPSAGLTLRYFAASGRKISLTQAGAATAHRSQLVAGEAGLGCSSSLPVTSGERLAIEGCAGDRLVGGGGVAGAGRAGLGGVFSFCTSHTNELSLAGRGSHEPKSEFLATPGGRCRRWRCRSRGPARRVIGGKPAGTMASTPGWLIRADPISWPAASSARKENVRSLPAGVCVLLKRVKLFAGGNGRAEHWGARSLSAYTTPLGPAGPGDAGRRTE